MVNISGQVSINTAPAVRSLQAAARAMENVEKAGKDVTIAQRAAMSAMAKGAAALAAENRRAAESFAKIGAAAIKADRDMRNADLNASNKRKNDRARTAADVGLIGARTDEVSARIVTNADESAAKVVLANARAATEEVRQRVALENAASITASRGLRDQIALRAEQTRITRQATKDEEAAARRARREIEGAQSAQLGTLHEARYVLGDLARGITVTSLALAALPVATAKIAIDWEKDFANVVRTVGVTGGAVERLKGQFVSLVTTMPVSFSELAEIGTLAGQLGIAETQIGSFTKTVAMFSSATGVSIDESATAFGRLNSLVPDVQGNFTELGNAILKVGVNSVATEQSIIRITTQIAAVASGAGFTSKEIIGLSGALASVGVPPELSRGVTTRVFGDIGKAVANGGIELEKWGATIGLTGAQFKAAWSNDASGTFVRFMDSIRQSGGGAALVLNDLGITSVRDVPILMRLAGAMDSTGRAGGLLQESIDNANNSAGEMERQYGITSGTVAAKLQVMIQNLMAFADAVGSTQLGTFGDILDTITGSLQDMSRGLDDAALGLSGLGITNGDLLAFGATAAVVVAGVGLLIAGLVKLAQGVVTMKVAMATAPAILQAFGLSAGAAAVPTAALGAAAETTGKSAGGLKGALSGLLGVISSAPVVIGAVVVGVEALGNAFGRAAEEGGASAKEITRVITDYKNALGGLQSVQDGGTQGPSGNFKAFQGAEELQRGLSALETKRNASFFDPFQGGEIEGFAGDAAAALKKLNTGYAEMINSGNGDKVIAQVGALAKQASLTDTAVSRLIYETDLNGYFKGLLQSNGIADTEANLVKLARGGLAAVGIEAEGATGAVEVFNEEISETEAAAQASIDGLASVVAGMFDFSTAIDAATEDGVLSMDKFMENIRKQAENQAALKSNIGKLLAMGISNDFLDYLTSLGPAGAEAIAGFVANPEYLTEAQELWRVNGEQSAVQWAAGAKSRADLIAQMGTEFGAEAGKNLGVAFDTANAEQLPQIAARAQAILTLHKLFPQASLEQLNATMDTEVPAGIDRAQLIMDYKKLHPKATTEDISSLMQNDLPLIIGEQQFYLDYMLLHPKATAEDVRAVMDRRIPEIRAQGQRYLDANELAAKLDTANAEATMNEFVNRRRVITIAAHVAAVDSVSGAGGYSSSGLPGYADGRAAGGPIFGPGTGTSDSIPMMLSNGEHVLTAKEVAAAGGQNAIYQLRRNILNGHYGRAAGGPAGNIQQAGALRSQSAYVSSSLDANAVAAIMALSTRPVVLKVDGRAIARATSEGARGLSQIGMRS